MNEVTLKLRSRVKSGVWSGGKGRGPGRGNSMCKDPEEEGKSRNTKITKLAESRVRI